MEDRQAEAIYILFENEMDTDAQRKKLIQVEREKYMNGIGQSYSPEQVRQMVMNQELRNGL